MTDLDTLRRALRAPAQPSGWPAGQALDVDQIIASGRRLRRRRRLTVAGVVVVVCVVAAVSGVLAGTGSNPGRSGPVPAQRPAAPSRLAHERSPAYPGPSGAGVPTPSPRNSLGPSAASSPSRMVTATPSGMSAPLPTPSR